MRRASVLATAVLALGALGAPAAAIAPDDVPDQGAAQLGRIAGETRYGTAAQTATRAYPDGASTVVVATGLNFPDALAASFFAGGRDAPILLVERDAVPTETADALNELAPERVVVLGGTDAITGDVVDDLRGQAETVTRVRGATRVETAARLALRGGEVGTAPNLSDRDATEELTTAIVSRADSFPDALAAGPLALAGRHPILLTDTDELPQATVDVLTDPDLGIEQVIITGGEVAVSQAVEDDIAALDGIASVHRVRGENRTATAVALGELTRAALGWDASTAGLARGDNFPDALTMAPLAAQRQASLFLTSNPQTIDGDTFAGIQDICEPLDRILITGGSVAVSADAAGEAKLASICADHAFPISADQEVPEDGKAGAEGDGWVTIAGQTICVAYDVEGLDGTANASHIHEGAAGEAGDVRLDLGAPNMTGFRATCGDDAQLAAELTANPEGYYVNIHTPDFPLGAARGQIAGGDEAPPATTVQLAGENEVGDDGQPVDDPAAGQGTLALTFGDGELCYELTVSGLE
jgi:putative cell wall-binding protein